MCLHGAARAAAHNGWCTAATGIIYEKSIENKFGWHSKKQYHLLDFGVVLNIPS